MALLSATKRKKKKKKKAKAKGPQPVCKRVRDPKTRRWKKKCAPKTRAKRPATKRTTVAKPKPPPARVTTPTAAAPAAAAPAPPPVAPHQPPPPSAAAPPPTTVPDPIPVPPPVPPAPAEGVPVYDGAFGVREATRLLWRAGFGPRPGEAEALAALGLDGAVAKLVDPGAQTFTGPAPHNEGAPLAPEDVWGHDHVWWLDRMVRTDQPLIERMTLIWHDWFATSNDGVGRQDLMLAQNELFRRRAFGSFRDLLHDVTVDHAMLVWLDGISNSKWSPNENYAREVMELFTLGADRGAYTETDVRELARCLTGWRARWDGERLVDFRFEQSRFDTGFKTLWYSTPHQRSDTYGWRGAGDLCLQNPYHRSFFVRKLWSYFIPTPPDEATAAALEHRYVANGWSIRAVLEGVLKHPALHTGATMVKPPIVHTAGMLRALGRGIVVDDWWWRSHDTGQRLFMPPNVAGWNEQGWLDTSTYKGRWNVVYGVLLNEFLQSSTAPPTEAAGPAVDRALGFWGDPAISAETRQALQNLAAQPKPSNMSDANWRALRQNALRHLIAMTPDYLVS